jgi:hypothetical protein
MLSSDPVSDITITMGIVPTGMYCASTFTVTGLPELIVASGKLNGLASIDIVVPLTTRLTTLTALGPVAGMLGLKGSDSSTVPPIQALL